MSTAAQARSTLPERLFPLGDPSAVDRLVDRLEWCAVFKAATSDKTFEAWFLVQKALETRVDVAVGLIQIPAGRAASDHVAARTGIAHRSPQLVLFHRGHAVAHLDERAIQPEPLAAFLGEHLPTAIRPRVVNEQVVALDAFRSLLHAFVEGTLPEERFQWAYLERLAKEASWRDEESFARLNSLFENPGGRELIPARLVAIEFQGQLAGRIGPLRQRASRLLRTLDAQKEVES